VLKGLSPPRRASLVTAGSEARRKAQELSFHLGATGKGKTGRVNCVSGLSISLPQAPEGGAAAPPVVVLAATDPQQ